MHLKNKNLIWNYIGFGMSFCINVILLPFILKYLSTEELALWYVFMSIGVFVTMFDFGFSPQIARFITYAYVGVEDIKKEGVFLRKQHSETININLLSGIFQTSKHLFFTIGFVIFTILGTIGTLYILQISKSTSTQNTLLAWTFYCIGCFINISYCYYSAFYKGIGDFVTLNKAIIASKCIQITLSVLGLLCGYGITSVAFAFLLSGVAFRVFLAFHIRKFKRKHSLTEKKTIDNKTLFRILWHNSWKEGLITLSRFLNIQSNTIICSLFLDYSETAIYGLSVQILTIISSISLIYFTTHLPSMNAASVDENKQNKYLILSKSWIMFVWIYIIMLILVIFIGFPILKYLKPDLFLSMQLFLFIAFYMFLESNHSLFASYISTSNKIPYYKAYFFSACIAICTSVIILSLTNWGIWGLILSNCIVQLFYNNWKWPKYVCKELKSNLFFLYRDGMKEILKQQK